MTEQEESTIEDRLPPFSWPAGTPQIQIGEIENFDPSQHPNVAEAFAQCKSLKPIDTQQYGDLENQG